MPHAHKPQTDGHDEQIFASPELEALLGVDETFRASQTATAVSLQVVAPIALASVIFSATSTRAYEAAQSSEQALQTALSGQQRILRQGSSLALALPHAPGLVNGAEPSGEVFTVVMTEPVLQGYVDPQRTQLLVLPPPREEMADASMLLEGTADDQADIDIDEDFLASLVIDESWRDDEDLSAPPQQANGLPNGVHSPKPKARLQHSASHLVDVYPLDSPASALVPSALKQESDDSAFCFMSPADCARLGFFSGDWAICEPHASGAEPTAPRLVRIFARDAPLSEGPAGTSPRPRLFLSPLLAHNIGLRLSEEPATIRLAQAHGLQADPHFPVADGVTVARVASPIATQKAYQHLFLRGLREHFEGKQRCVAVGDLIAVPIAEGEARWGEAKVGGTEPGPDGELECVKPRTSLECSADVRDRLATLAGPPTSTVFFKITSLEVGSSQHKPNGSVPSDLEGKVLGGDFGAVIDPHVTKLVQTGIEHSVVPDVSVWAGVGKSTLVSIPLARRFNRNAGDVSPRPAPADEAAPFTKLLSYVQAALRPGASEYDLHLTVLLIGARSSGKRTLARQVARAAGFHFFDVNCYELLGETDVKTEATLRARFERGIGSTPCVMLLSHVEALARKSQALETGQEPAMTTILQECFAEARKGWKSSGYPLIVVGTTNDPDKIPTGVLGAFKREIKLEAPAEGQRFEMLRTITADDLIAPDVSLRAIAVQTAALVAGDLVDLVARARASATDRALHSTSGAEEVDVRDIAAAGVALTSADFNLALDQARSSYSESIGAPKIPNVTWDDVGGLASVKSEILDTIQLPLEHPELFAEGLKKRSGILLYGPPGTGKTLLAKAVATSCSLNFFSVKGPELLNMYIGESESNVRRVFQRARDAKPCVIFFDELDSVAPKRGNQGDSGGVMDRIVSQLLAELDGMADSTGGADVFVIGATNRPDLLDPALLRPGRFDRMLYLGISDTHDAQLKIMQALTRKFKLDPATDLRRVAERCPFNYTGADFYALCSDAMLKAMTRKAEAVDAKIGLLNGRPPYSTGQAAVLTPQYYLAEMATPDDVEVLVAQEDFEKALAELQPSVSVSELEHYKAVQGKFSSQTMNAPKEKAQPADGPSEGTATVPGKGKGKGKGKARADPDEDGVLAGPIEAVAPRRDKGKGKAVE